MKKQIFKGVATALITPFKDGKVCYSELEKLIEDQIAAGINALVICGTTGEAATMSDEEQIATIEFSVKVANKRIPIIAGAGSNNTAHAIELSKKSIEVGADALLIVTPYYNKTSQKGLIEMYNAIANSVNKPIILYNVPSRTGVNIEPSTYVELAKNPNIVAIKEAGSNFSKICDTFQMIPEDISVYSGNDDLVVPILSMGGQGVISVLSNVIPKETVEMTNLYFEGKVKEAAALQLKYLPLIHALFSDVNPIPVKSAMKLLGYCDGEMRLPLIPMDSAKEEVLKNEMVKLGLNVK